MAKKNVSVGSGRSAENFPLGIRCVDTVTGFDGTATAVVAYATGSTRVQITALVEGKPVDHWFDAGSVKFG